MNNIFLLPYQKNFVIAGLVKPILDYRDTTLNFDI